MIRFTLLFLSVTAVLAADESLTWQQLPALPEPRGVAAPFAGVSGGALLVAGGANFPGGMPWEGGRKVWHDRVWLLAEPGGAWREAGRLPRPLAYGVSVTARDAVVCIGGSDSDRHHADSFRLTWNENALTAAPLPPLPIPLANHCGAIVSRHFLYVACGAEAPGERSASNRVFVLHLQSRPGTAWDERPALPGKPRILAAAAGLGSTFFVFGGVALEKQDAEDVKRVYLRDAWSCEPGDGWKRLADAPRPIAAVPSPVPFVDGKFLFLAGDDGTLAGFTPMEKHPGFPKTILAYDPARDRWSEAGETPAPRATAPCVEWRGMFMIPSGEVRPGVRSPEIWGLRIP